MLASDPIRRLSNPAGAVVSGPSDGVSGPSEANGGSPHERRGPFAFAATAGALAAWAGLVAAAALFGEQLVRRVPQSRIFAPPLVGRLDERLPPAVLVPIAVGLLALWLSPRLAARLGWRRLLVAAFLASVGWAVAVAIANGFSELVRPVRLPNDYLADVSLIRSPGLFLSTFVEHIGRFHQHVRGHPPGMVLILWAMNRVGLDGPGWEAALEILGGAAMVPAVLVSLREVAGERVARSAAPFVVFAPAVVWIATTADALFAGMAAWGIALVLMSLVRRGRSSDGLALAGGVVFGEALFLTYGIVVLAAIPVIVAVRQRRVRPLVVWALGVAGVFAAFAGVGFWWPAGLRATVAQYRAGVSRFRPQSYFWYGDLAAFAIVLGPAAAVGLSRLRDPRAWMLVGGAALAVILADVSGLSKAEVERIWLPFFPWIMLACCSLGRWGPGTNDSGTGASLTGLRPWLALSMASTLVVQILVRTTW